MNRRERRAAQRQARARIAPAIKTVISGMANTAKGQPWIVAYWAFEDFGGMLERHAFGPHAGGTVDEANDVLAEMATMLVEGMGVPAKECADPFQAAVYVAASRGDLHRAGQRFIDECGGHDAVGAAMSEWARDNKTLLEKLPRALPMYGGMKQGDGPPGSVNDLLDKWTDVARKHFEILGEVDPLAVGILPDGREMFFTMRGFERVSEKYRFHKIASQRLSEFGAIRTVFVYEGWAVPSGTDVEPNKAEGREEVITATVSDGETEWTSYSVIERDWESGKATLKEPEKGESMSIRRMGAETPAGTA